MASIKSTHKTDILIIGGGGAAAMAALEASRLGIKPLLVCKDTFLGGATVQASGGTAIPFLLEDSPETFIADTLASGAFINNHILVRILAEEARKIFFGLEEEGFILDRSSPDQIRATKRSEGHSFLRSYADRRQTHGVVNFLKQRVFQEKIPLLEERIVLRLFTEEGRIQGALLFSLEDGEFELISSRLVVLATGGCGQLYSITTNSNCLTGDGYALAFQAGAELMDMEMVQFLPLAFPFPATIRGAIIGMCSLFGPKVRLYSGLGERYMGRYAPSELEYATRDVVARANYLEIQEGRGTKRRTIIVDPTENDRSKLKEYRDSSAVIYGMLAETFGEKAAAWEAPFEAIPSQHFMMGGVKIDERCRSSVRNLLCCGEVSGGIHGANRLSGNALTEIYVFGRRAGRTAVDQAPGIPLKLPHPEIIRAEVDRIVALLNNSRGVSPFRFKQELQKVMWDCVGIVRDGEGLKRALENFCTLERKFCRISTKCKEKHWNRQWLEVLELGLMLQTAKLIATSALCRQESRGSHYRRDFPDPDGDWLKNIVLCKDQNGEIKITFTPVSPVRKKSP
jgi:fumarate reductase (CoM/CoB) subunit A